MDEILHDLVFYIYTPPWVDWSAGTKVLHYLCDSLNKNGWESFLCIHGPRLNTEDVNKNLKTPVVSQEISNKHRSEGKRIIVVYPEGIIGNPVGGDIIVRWILNFPSLLGGKSSFLPGEIVWAYSKNIADAYVSSNKIKIPIMFIPAIKLSEIEASIEAPVVAGDYEVIYAQKYRALGGKPDLIPEHNLIEITRFNRSSTTRSQTLNLIKHAKRVHIYENSSIASEAALFGVPVVCHKNVFFDSLISTDELGEDGVSWHPYPGLPVNRDNSRRKLYESWHNLDANLLKCIDQLPMNLSSEFEGKSLSIPHRRLASRHLIDRGSILIRQKGLRVFLRFASNYIKRWLR